MPEGPPSPAGAALRALSARSRAGSWKNPCIVSCFVMFPMPSPKLCGSVPAYRSSLAFRSAPVPSARPPAWATPSGGTVFARVSCVRACARPRASCAGAVRAPDCARETQGARPLRKRGGSWKDPCNVSCFVMFPMPSREALRFRSCISFLRRVPFRSCSVRAAAGLGDPRAAGQFLRAYPACAPVPARACLAPARFAHLIARARRRAHVSPSFPPEFFSAPAIVSLRRKEKAAPEAAFSLPAFYYTFSPSQAPWREKYEYFSTLSSSRPALAKAGDGASAACPGPRSYRMHTSHFRLICGAPCTVLTARAFAPKLGSSPAPEGGDPASVLPMPPQPVKNALFSTG